MAGSDTTSVRSPRRARLANPPVEVLGDEPQRSVLRRRGLPVSGLPSGSSRRRRPRRGDRVPRRRRGGFEWPPHRPSATKPPYELQPGTGRRGPGELWRRFDDAVDELNRAATGSDLLAVASAYDQLADAATELAEAVERDDRSNGLLVERRARRSA
jgi:hypothetical protein